MIPSGSADPNYTKKKESVNDLFLNYEKDILDRVVNS